MNNQIKGETAVGSEVIVDTDQSGYISPLVSYNFIDNKSDFDSFYVF